MMITQRHKKRQKQEKQEKTQVQRQSNMRALSVRAWHKAQSKQMVQRLFE